MKVKETHRKERYRKEELTEGRKLSFSFLKGIDHNYKCLYLEYFKPNER